MTLQEWHTTVVVPCYNEAERLDEDEFIRLADLPNIRLLFVDDGSTDATSVVLGRLAEASQSIEVFTLDANMGKAEAVRRGLLLAVRNGATITGYYDADLATPAKELERLVHTMDERPELAAAFGCRVARLGSSIRRSLGRHYMGRLYATLASVALGTSVYDTQCGAKLFRVGPSLVAALAEPFRSAWSFDVELLNRLLTGSTEVPPVPTSAFYEMPLESWRDVEGSKMGPAQAASAFLDLILMTRTSHVRRRTGLPAPTVARWRGGVPHRRLGPAAANTSRAAGVASPDGEPAAQVRPVPIAVSGKEAG